MVQATAGPRMTRFARPAPPALLFSDLDGTLLDDDYRFDAAVSALARLEAAGIPLILTSSKTLPEMRLIRSAMDLTSPLIFENGAGIAIPHDHFDPAQLDGPLEPEVFGPGYAALREIVTTLRERHGFQFRGFGDMTSGEVARLTGLDQLSAARARQRIGSEPGLWEGSEAEREDFVRALAAEGLRMVRGGRFHHLMPKVDKAGAMSALVARYRKYWPDASLTVVAAGDSPNDFDMLRAADRAVVVRRRDGTWMPLKHHGGAVRTTEIGPAGWSTSIHRILDELDVPESPYAPDGEHDRSSP